MIVAVASGKSGAGGVKFARGWLSIGEAMAPPVTRALFRKFRTGGYMEITVDDSNFQKEVLESELPVLVDFWAPWCGPCNMVAPAVAEIAQEYAGKIKVCKVNVDKASATANSFGIASIPTLMVFKKGEVVEQIIGAVPKSQIISKITAVL